MLELTAEKVIALSPNICLLRDADCIFLSVLQLDQRLAQFLVIKNKALYTFENRFLCEHRFHFSGINAQGYNYWVIW